MLICGWSSSSRWGNLVIIHMSDIHSSGDSRLLPLWLAVHGDAGKVSDLHTFSNLSPVWSWERCCMLHLELHWPRIMMLYTVRPHSWCFVATVKLLQVFFSPCIHVSGSLALVVRFTCFAYNLVGHRIPCAVASFLLSAWKTLLSSTLFTSPRVRWLQLTFQRDSSSFHNFEPHCSVSAWFLLDFFDLLC